MTKIKYTSTSKRFQDGKIKTEYLVTENGKNMDQSMIGSVLYSDDLIRKRMREFNEGTIRVESLTKIITTTQFETGR